MIGDDRYGCGDEPLEGDIPERPEGEDFDVNVEIEVDEEEEREFNRYYGEDGPFGRNGVFGPKGPFGPDGPFGRKGPFGDHGPFAAGRGGHRGKRRKPMVRGGELRLVLLALIAEEPRHGYELIKALEGMTGGAWAPSPGTVYPTLSLLEDEGMIEQVPGDDNRKAYRATKDGLGEAADNREEIERLFRRLGRQAKREKHNPAPDLFRSLGNLAAVLTNRAATGRFDSKARAEIVDMIDELAKKIERL